ncbi:SDR family NAD(P)-dependent oxidoreductase [Rhizobiales bacterium]|uniref:SDR family NAD(P)-dependent oxidoreductase n=1 Tax=Hongsoonwoonella zoysiae TaxID=2821844 RepID=UPI0015617536|nr:SDR family NAD(P)-dependent oxidoreductase [Hongsoonwoonella zoysiae]NRG18258.1 SDR family NAD(P)-dependent oxidoreductase [Hongsoonwoonella zoysiae]
MHEAVRKGNIAIVTGGASGIGLAAARRFVDLGLRVCIADLPGKALDSARDTLGGDGRVLTVPTDISHVEQLKALKARVQAEWGQVSVLMNNAGVQPGSSIFDIEDTWQRIIDVNMWGVIRSAQIFAPEMIAADRPGLIINTGSKQGITTPPGDPAYNVSKAGVKVFTEALQHELRSTPACKVEARLFIPGFVFTPLTARGRIEKPDGAWTPEETVAFLFDALGREDFYILCPDNEVDHATDEKRILWAAGDIAENRPPLSRWHPGYGEAFVDWLKQ